jgi:hypothetical protein
LGNRNSAVISLSMPPEMAGDYRRLARQRGVTASELFRVMFEDFRKRHLLAEYRELQGYGRSKAAERGISEEDVERLVFGNR